MQLTCGKCHQVIEFSGARPAYCAYCGQALSDTEPLARPECLHEAPTLAPGEPGAPLAAESPTVVGGYKLIGAIGAGGMGTVYEAEEIATGRRVAIKLTSPGYASAADTLERFRQEGRLASMVGHPRCVFVLAVGEEGGRPYIVMELMPGTTLQDLVRERGPLPPGEAVAKILDVIAGLQAAHRLDVIHRDVKPSNCFVDADGRVKVGDFGLAKSAAGSSHLTRTGTFVGTPHYASPEQVRGEAIDPQTDVYSTAATLYYLLTGQPPFSGSDATATLARIVSDPAPSVRSIRPELPAALDRVVLRGLERAREHRWHDLEAFRQALLPFLPRPRTLGGLAGWLGGLFGQPAPARSKPPTRTGGWLLYLLRSRRLGPVAPQATHFPERIGRFAIRGALRSTAAERILFGEDATLGRKVLIWLRPLSQGSLNRVRQEVGRTTRLRWVAHGTLNDAQWDAFLVPSGTPLPELVGDEGVLPWSDVLPLLRQLTDELVAACADATLPSALALAQVWVEQDGRVQLTDSVLTDPSLDAETAATGAEQERALAFLHQVARLALEGQGTQGPSPRVPIRAPVPLHARPVLDRLAGVQPPYEDVRQVQADLTAIQGRPAEITPARWAAHVALQGLLLVLVVVAFYLGVALVAGRLVDWLSWNVAILAGGSLWPALWVASAIHFRAGWTFSILGTAVVRADGQPASRLRCAARALVVWLPLLGFLIWKHARAESLSDFQESWRTSWSGVTLILFLYLVLALVFRARGLQDRLAGTFLVPR
jgi:hypothetical protein